jgi:NTE family protein
VPRIDAAGLSCANIVAMSSTDPTDPTDPTVALVLGAGGVLGTAYHVGVLSGLAEVLDFDPRRAELIVGTSAGATTASTLRAGISAADHFARATGREMSDEGEAISAKASTVVDLSEARFAGLGLPSSARLIAGGIRPLGRGRPILSLAGAMPRGSMPLSPLIERTNQLHDDKWPEPPTWIVTVSMATAKRSVFGRDDLPTADLGSAVAASSAVPSMFEPVRIGPNEYIDGAVHSTTNADLVAPLGFDAVIVSAPMAIDAESTSYRSTGFGRTWHTRTLEREVAAFPRRRRVATLAPSEDLLSSMGDDNMDSSRVASVAEHSRAETIGLMSSDRYRTFRQLFGAI